MDACGFLIFPVFLEGCEVMLDGVQVGRIGWQKQQRGAGVLDEVRRFRSFVKGRVVHDDQVLVGQTRTQPGFEPGVEHRGIAGAFEEERFFKIQPDAGGDQRGARSAVP